MRGKNKDDEMEHIGPTLSTNVLFQMTDIQGDGDKNPGYKYVVSLQFAQIFLCVSPFSCFHLHWGEYFWGYVPCHQIGTKKCLMEVKEAKQCQYLKRKKSIKVVQ